MFVKICGITSEDDALLAVALGADAVGFIFAPSPRQIAVQKVYDITRRLPPEILTVGVFRDMLPPRVVDMVQSSGVKAAQLHGHESPSDVSEIAKHVRFVIKAVTAGTVDATRADQFNTDYILVDSAKPGSGSTFDWDLVVNVPEVPKLILAGGLTPENVAEGIAAVKPWGVDVATGVEASPGKKDPIALKRFIENAKRAAPTPHRGSDDLPYDWTDE